MEHTFYDSILRRQDAVTAIACRRGGVQSALLGVSWIEDFQALIVSPDARLRRSRDLRDQRIGLPAVQIEDGSARVHALRGATVALESEGLYHRHVQWVDLAPAETTGHRLPTAYAAEIHALQTGAVKAVYVRGPAGLEAARLAGARVLFDIGSQRDPWVRAHTALLQTLTTNAALLREHPEVVEEAVREQSPRLPLRTSLDEAAIGALETLKVFMVRWGLIDGDFSVASWANPQPVVPVRPQTVPIQRTGSWIAPPAAESGLRMSA